METTRGEKDGKKSFYAFKKTTKVNKQDESIFRKQDTRSTHTDGIIHIF